MAFDRLHRHLLRVAYRVLRLLPPSWRHRRQAAIVAVWSRGELLLVRHSYRPGCALPGGGARRRETQRDAACRELAEEVGISAPPEALTPVYNTIPVCIFEYCPVERPEPRIDNREIIEAFYADPYGVEDLAAYVKSYLLSRPFRPPRA